MGLRLKVLLKTQKRGNAPEEYEDAIAWRNGSPESSDDFPLVAAIADGATESSFSRLWAELLVTEFVQKPFATTEEMSLAVIRCRRFWNRMVQRKPLPWYAEEKLRMGAFSTFLGVQFFAPNTDGIGMWQAIALGDSCMFQIGLNGLLMQLPITAYEDFGSAPPLVSTNPDYNNRLWDKVTCKEGAWSNDQFFLLMTDALAQWATKENPDRTFWDAMLDSHDDASASFRDWIDMQRESKAIRNDDATLAVVRDNETTGT